MQHIAKQIIRVKPTGIIDYVSYEKVSETIIQAVSSKPTAFKNSAPKLGSCTSCGEIHEKGKCLANNKDCAYCKKPGHLIRVCRKLAYKEKMKISFQVLNKKNLRPNQQNLINLRKIQYRNLQFFQQ